MSKAETTNDILTNAINLIIKNSVNVKERFDKYKEFRDRLRAIDSKNKEQIENEYRDLCVDVLHESLEFISKQISDYKQIGDMAAQALDIDIANKLSDKLNMGVGVASVFTNVTK